MNSEFGMRNAELRIQVLMQSTNRQELKLIV